MTKNRLDILLIEDNEDDALLIREMLTEAGGEFRFKISWKDSLENGLEHLKTSPHGCHHLVILDLHFPRSDGLNTLTTVLKDAPDIPIVVFTGLEDEAMANEAIRLGAQDYLMKGKINDFVLKRVIIHAIERFKILREKERLIRELKEAQDNIHVLSGLIPICAHCKKVRDDKGYWTQVETYIRNHSGADFSHGLCPDCTDKYYPDLE